MDRSELRRVMVVAVSVLPTLVKTACGTLFGAAVGAGSGAIIGVGTGHDPGKGALIGARADAISEILR